MVGITRQSIQQVTRSELDSMYLNEFVRNIRTRRQECVLHKYFQFLDRYYHTAVTKWLKYDDEDYLDMGLSISDAIGKDFTIENTTWIQRFMNASMLMNGDEAGYRLVPTKGFVTGRKIHEHFRQLLVIRLGLYRR